MKWLRWVFHVTFVVLALTLAAARGQAAPASSASSAPTGRTVDFQPGVRIDFARRQVELDGRIVLREGELELFACSGRAKAHESIVSLTARPRHVHQALGLIGRTPGHPSSFDEATQTEQPAAGDAVDVLVRWSDRGVERTVAATDWMQDLATGKPLARTHWLFAGSVKTPEGRFAADIDGVVIPTVDFPSGVLAIVPPAATTQSAGRSATTQATASAASSRPHPSSASADGRATAEGDAAAQAEGAMHVDQPGDLQLAPRTELIPPLGTKVTVILRAAAEPHSLRIDRFGRWRWDGEPADAAALGVTLRALPPDASIRVEVAAECVPADPERVLALLQDARPGGRGIEWTTPADLSFPQSDPRAERLFLAGQSPLRPGAVENIRAEFTRVVATVVEQWAAIERLIDAASSQPSRTVDEPPGGPGD